MALPTLSKMSESVKSSVKNRSKDLADSISKRVSPKRVINRSVNALTSKLGSEVPEISAVGSILSDFMSDLKNGLKDDKKKQTQASSEQTEKLVQIRKNTGDTTDTLMEVLKVVDHRLFEQIRGNADRLAELRTMTGIAANANMISMEQLEALRKANALKEKESKESKFKKQKEDSKLTKPKTVDEKTKNLKEKHGLLSFLGGTFLARLLGGFGVIMEGIFIALGGKALFNMSKKLLGIPTDPSRKVAGFNSRGQPIDSKGKFVKQTSRNMKLAEKADKMKKVAAAGGSASKAAKAGSSIVGAAKAVARGTGVLTLVMVVVDALIGGFTEGIKSFRAGNTGPKIVADFIFGALKGVVQGLVDTFKFVFTTLPPFIFKVGEELIKTIGSTFLPPIKEKAKEFGTYVSDGISSMLSAAGEWIKSAFDNIKYAMITSIKSMINSVVDKTHTRALLPDSIKTFLSTPEPIPHTGELSVKSKQTTSAAQIIAGQKTINDFAMDSKLTNQPSSSNNILTAPITTNVQNNTVIPGNLHTRNPESPLFGSSKVSY